VYGFRIEGFDKGEQKFEYQFRIGGGTSEMGWLMASGNVTGKKEGKEFAFPLNVSITVAKKGDRWLVAAMHFSTLTAVRRQERKVRNSERWTFCYERRNIR
jgi:hypothetical protein